MNLDDVGSRFYLMLLLLLLLTATEGENQTTANGSLSCVLACDVIKTRSE